MARSGATHPDASARPRPRPGTHPRSGAGARAGPDSLAAPAGSGTRSGPGTAARTGAAPVVSGPPPARPAPDQPAVVLLAAAAGAIDAIAFIALGHVFSGVMTGNLALLGIAAGNGHPGDVKEPLIALAGYIAGAAAAARICRDVVPDRSTWPARVLFCLAGEAVLLIGWAAVWGATSGHPGALTRYGLLCAAALAMGVQSAAMISAGPTAKPSTYLTGTLTVFITRGTRVARGTDRWVPVRLAALVCGATVAAVLHRTAAGWSGALPPALVVTAVLTALRHSRARHWPSP